MSRTRIICEKHGAPLIHCECTHPAVDYANSSDASAGSSLLWVTNHPKTVKGMWPRRIGVVYIEGPPKATESRTAEKLASEGLVGVYVDMDENEYRKLPLARTPADMKTNDQALPHGGARKPLE